MSLTPEQIQGFKTTLSDARSVTNESMNSQQVEIALALVQMLNNGQPAVWDFEKCDALIGRFAGEISTNGTQNINEIMINMANEANAPIASGTILQVEWYRKLLLKLLAGGIAFTTLQTYAPGVIGFALDSAYLMFSALTAQNVSVEKIAFESAKDSPFSVGPFAQAAAQASLNLVKATLYACAATAGQCAYSIGKSIPYTDCLKYGTELLGLALATNVAKKAATRVANVTSMVYGVVINGTVDEKIAMWFSQGGPQQVQAAISQSTANFIDATKAALIDGLRAVDEINRGINIDKPANRFVSNVNDVILDWLKEYVSRFSDDNNVRLGELMEALATIDFEQNKEESIQKVARQLKVDPNDPGFRGLIAAYTLATDKSQIERSASLRGKYRLDPLPKKTFKSASLETDTFAFPAGDNNPFKTRYNTKDTNRFNPVLPFDNKASATFKVESQLKIYKPLENKLRELKLSKVIFPRVSKFVGQTIFNVVSQYSEDIQSELIDVINKTTTQILTGDSRTNKTIENKNKLKYMATIEKYLLNSDKKDTGQVEISYDELAHDNSFVVDEVADNSMDTAGGRRRKSRRHKKRKATLKRRQMKRRRTRKGKKRRHSKKRHH
jgi:hypothetical protein